MYAVIMLLYWVLISLQLLFKVIELHNTVVYLNNCIFSKLFKRMIILDVLNIVIYKINIVLINSMTLLRFPMFMFLVICCIAHIIPIKISTSDYVNVKYKIHQVFKFHKICLVNWYFIFKCIAQLYLFIRSYF